MFLPIAFSLVVIVTLQSITNHIEITILGIVGAKDFSSLQVSNIFFLTKCSRAQVKYTCAPPFPAHEAIKPQSDKAKANDSPPKPTLDKPFNGQSGATPLPNNPNCLHLSHFSSVLYRSELSDRIAYHVIPFRKFPISYYNELHIFGIFRLGYTYRNKPSELPKEMEYIVYKSSVNSESPNIYIPIIREIPINRNQLNKLFGKLRIIEKVRFQLIGKIRTIENI